MFNDIISEEDIKTFENYQKENIEKTPDEVQGHTMNEVNKMW